MAHLDLRQRGRQDDGQGGDALGRVDGDAADVGGPGWSRQQDRVGGLLERGVLVGKVDVLDQVGGIFASLYAPLFAIGCPQQV
jgi:hypothetical protein